QYGERVWNITEGSTEDKAHDAIEKTVAFFHDLGIDTKLSDYTQNYEGTAEEIAQRFTDRGWLGLGEHQTLSPDKVEKIVKMSY
ncbi:MAG: NADP-dependent alcohol dehydrogenase, partial [Patiriisocius sp.]